MIDTHCHLTYEPLHSQVRQVIADAVAAGVDRMITVGTRPDDARLAAALSEQFANVFSTVGVHPHYADKCADQAAIDAVMRELCERPKVVAFGEMGLDQHYPEPSLAVQRQCFGWQLEIISSLSNAAPNPIIIHNREATDATLAMLRESGLDPQRFVFHCFTGTMDELRAILDFGAMVSFTGITTFGSAREIAACAKATPLDRMMIETDSPYLTPEPHRKVRPNQPRYVVYVAEFLAKLKGMAMEELVAAVDGNAVKFFGLDRAASER